MIASLTPLPVADDFDRPTYVTTWTARFQEELAQDCSIDHLSLLDHDSVTPYLSTYLILFRV